MSVVYSDIKKLVKACVKDCIDQKCEKHLIIDDYVVFYFSPCDDTILFNWHMLGAHHFISDMDECVKLCRGTDTVIDILTMLVCMTLVKNAGIPVRNNKDKYLSSDCKELFGWK